MKRFNDGLDRPQKAPASQLYWADLMRDLTPLSDGARGLWMMMLCHMALSPRRGYLVTADGLGWNQESILRLSGDAGQSAKKHFLELKQNGVFSVNQDGIIYNRRMVRDAELSELRQVAGNKGVEARKQQAQQQILVNQKSTTAGDLGQRLVEQNADFGQPKIDHSPRARAHTSSSSSSSPLIPPHAPPPGGVPADAVPNTKRTRTRRQDSGVAPVTDGDAKYRLSNGSLDYDAMERDFQAKRQASAKNGVPA